MFAFRLLSHRLCSVKLREEVFNPQRLDTGGRPQLAKLGGTFFRCVFECMKVRPQLLQRSQCIA